MEQPVITQQLQNSRYFHLNFERWMKRRNSSYKTRTFKNALMKSKKESELYLQHIDRGRQLLSNFTQCLARKTYYSKFVLIWSYLNNEQKVPSFNRQTSQLSNFLCRITSVRGLQTSAIANEILSWANATQQSTFVAQWERDFLCNVTESRFGHTKTGLW